MKIELSSILLSQIKKLIKPDLEKYKDVVNIPYKELIDEIYNPVVKRTLIQTVKIINALRKKYGEFKQIIIEMPRDEDIEYIRNKKDKKKEIQKIIAEESQAVAKAMEYAGLELSEEESKNNQLGLKLKLYARQRGLSPYTGIKIDPLKLAKNNFDYEIDHIIPLSISFDDSQANKVLVESTQNQLKGNKTPFMYLNNNNKEWDYDQYKKYVNEISKPKNELPTIRKKQKELMLFEEDISKQEVVKGFINRNINDTRYSSREVLNLLQRFFSAKGKETKIKVITGVYTSNFRKNYIGFPKDREIDFSHHAFDALIAAYSVINLDRISKNIFNIETGEILDLEKYNEYVNKYKKNIYDMNIDLIRREFNSIKCKIKYHHKVDRKINRKISKDLIYSTREFDGDNYIINTIKDIYNDKFCKDFFKQYKKDKTSFLMYKNDKKTWDIIETIIQIYPDVENPFRKYLETEGEKIRKYSKNKNGPFVENLKYIKEKVGKHVDITKAYNTSKLIVKLDLYPFRTDVFFDNKNNKYILVPISYYDFKYNNGKYGINKTKYNKALNKEGILDEIDYIIEGNGNYVFKFSLHKNEIIEFGASKEESEKYRFLSKTYKEPNRIECKHVHRKNKDNERITKTIGTKIKYFKKINVDILGNEYLINKEKFIFDFYLDNKNKK